MEGVHKVSATYSGLSWEITMGGFCVRVYHATARGSVLPSVFLLGKGERGCCLQQYLAYLKICY